jgi:Leucine-rich repeat (LRR) protein
MSQQILTAGQLLIKNPIDDTFKPLSEIRCFSSNLVFTRIPKGNLIESLLGSPNIVCGSFNCARTNIKSLNHCPREIYGDFTLDNTPIKNLHGFPSKIDGKISCNYTLITSLEGIPNKTYETIYASFCEINTLEGVPNCLGSLVLDNNKITDFNTVSTKNIRIIYTLNLSNNRLKSLFGISKVFSEIAFLNISGNDIRTGILELFKIKGLYRITINDDHKLENIINRYLEEKDVFKCQEELITEG